MKEHAMNFFDGEKWEKWEKWNSTDDNFSKCAHVKSNLIYGHLPEDKPDVSIMIPSFRRADTLKEAIDSALAQKTQYSYTITVVDNDGDGDEATDTLMKDYCERHPNILYYRHEKNIGVFGNWNRCIELAQADWMCMLHDDDMMYENALETLYSIAKTEKYGIICCTSSVLDERDGESHKFIGFGPVINFLEKLFIKVRNGKLIPMSSHDIERGVIIGSALLMVRVKDAISGGGYNDEHSPISDGVFTQKMIKLYGGVYLPVPLYNYRFWKTNSAYIESSLAVLQMVAEWMGYVYKQANYPEEKCIQRYYEFLVYYYSMFTENKIDVSFDEIKDMFHLPDKYCNPVIRRMIVYKYVFRMGMLQFRS